MEQQGINSILLDNISCNDLIAISIRNKNIARILYPLYDEDATCFDIMLKGIASPNKYITLTPNMVDYIKLQYNHANELENAFFKWWAISMVEYIEKAVKHSTPLLDNVAGNWTVDAEKCNVVFENQKLVDHLTRVYIIETKCLSHANEKFPVYHGVAVSSIVNGAPYVSITFGHGLAPENSRSRQTKPYETIFDRNTTFTVFLQPDIRDIESQLQGLRFFRSDDAVTSKIFPTHRIRPSEKRSAMNLTISMQTNYAKLNSVQQQAIVNMYNMRNEHAFLLEGPPGTGKTEVIAQLASILTYNNTGPIIIITPTNIAANVLTQRIIDHDVIGEDSFKRIMSARKDPDKLPDSIVHASFYYTSGCGKKVFKVPDNAEMKKFAVIVTTKGMSSSIQGIGKDHFKTIIIDEAGQLNEGDTATILSYFCGFDTKIILAGDTKQLGKICVTTSLSPYTKETSFSTMMRLSENEFYKNNPSLKIQLVFNYRSDEEIMDLYSKTMYEGSLRTTNPPGHDSLYNSAVLDNQTIPIRFHDCVSHEYTDDMGSFYNMKEVEIAVKYAHDLIQSGVHPTDICIVTPYKAQNKKMRDVLKLGGLKVMVNTVAAIQSAEKRVVICSFVRTDGIGFIADNRLPNTMISRAKQMLICIGDLKNLSSNSEYFTDLMRLLETNNLICYDS